MKVKRAPVLKGVDVPLETFEHTQIAVYLCGLFAVACVCYDSVQVRYLYKVCLMLICVSLSLHAADICELAFLLTQALPSCVSVLAGCHAKICHQPQMVLFIRYLVFPCCF